MHEITYHYDSIKDIMICTPLRCGTNFTHIITKIQPSFNPVYLKEYTQADMILHASGFKIIEKWKNTKFFYTYRNPVTRYISGITRLPLFQENKIPIYEPNLLNESHFKKAASELYLEKDAKKLYNFTYGDEHLVPIITLLCLLYSHGNENVTLLNIRDINDLIKSIFDYEDIKVKRLMSIVRARTDSNNLPGHLDLLFKHIQKGIPEYRKDSNNWSFWDWIELECNLFDFLENQKELDKKLLIDKLSIELRNPKSLVLLESFSDIISLSEIYDFSNIKIKNALDIAKKDLPKLIENR